MSIESDREHRYSTFELDVHWSSGRRPDAELELHLGTCARCRSYIAELETLAAMPAPPRGRGLAGGRAAVGAALSGQRLRALSLAAAGAIATAAGVLLFAGLRGGVDGEGERPPGYVGIKGTPAVQVLLRRDERTAIWDGSSALRPGDAVALRVACEGFTHVSVAAPEGPAGPWVRLADGACPSGGAPLPFTLVVDERAGDELLAVVLSDRRLEYAALEESIRRVERAPDVWVVRIVFPKSAELP